MGIGIICLFDNLRFATHTENSRNARKPTSSTSSVYKGISFVKHCNKWKAEIGLNGTKQCLGLFFTEREAAEAYNEAALKHYGEFANINVSE